MVVDDSVIHWAVADADVVAELAAFDIGPDDGDDVTAAQIAYRLRDRWSALSHLASAMSASCNALMNDLLHLDDAFVAHICESPVAMLHVAVLQALRQRCPLLDTEGYPCLGAHRLPVVYISDTFPYVDALRRACRRLLLPPDKCIKVVPVTVPATTTGVAGLDLDALSRAIDDDESQGAMPLIVFAAVPTTLNRDGRLVHRDDDLVRLKALCDAHGVWIHVHGADLRFAAADDRPDVVVTALDAADSFVVRPGRDWQSFGAGPDTVVVMVRVGAAPAPPAVAADAAAPWTVAAPLWIAVTALAGPLQRSADAHVELVRYAAMRAATTYGDQFALRWSSHTDVRPSFQVVVAAGVGDLSLRSTTLNGIILERVAGALAQLGWSVALDDLTDDIVVFVQPLASASSASALFPVVDAFLAGVSAQVDRMAAGIACRDALRALVDASAEFDWVDGARVSSSPVGIGVIRLVPPFLPDGADARDAVNGLNDCLARRLFDLSNVFRGCITDDGCVGVAILTVPDPCPADDDDQVARSIYDLVARTQAQIDYPDEVIALLSDALQTGIVEAQTHLEEMQQRHYSAIDLIRAVPLIGSVVGWFAAPADTDPAGHARPASLGQSFDLKSRNLSKRTSIPAPPVPEPPPDQAVVVVAEADKGAAALSQEPGGGDDKDAAAVKSADGNQTEPSPSSLSSQA
ncbi:Uncharacterized protein PBTT_09703 [Plasmodiophora brassicae]